MRCGFGPKGRKKKAQGEALGSQAFTVQALKGRNRKGRSMPQSVFQDPIQLVFSTKNREPLIGLDIEAELHRYLSGILRTYHCPAILIGSGSDHVHILLAMGRTISFADLVEELKTGSSKWIKTKGSQFRPSKASLFSRRIWYMFFG